METSKYIDRFKGLAQDGKDAFELIGDCLLVEKIAEPELKTSSGIVIAGGSIRQVGTMLENTPTWVRILAVGQGYYDDVNKLDIPLNCSPGDIVLVGKVSVKWFSSFGTMANYEAETIGLTRESEIQLRFKGQGGYQKAFEILNSKGQGSSAERA